MTTFVLLSICNEALDFVIAMFVGNVAFATWEGLLRFRIPNGIRVLNKNTNSNIEEVEFVSNTKYKYR
jgi:hypothetical protein